MAKEILCGYGIDVDAIAAQLASYGGEGSPGDIHRERLAERAAAPAKLEREGALYGQPRTRLAVTMADHLLQPPDDTVRHRLALIEKDQPLLLARSRAARVDAVS